MKHIFAGGRHLAIFSDAITKLEIKCRIKLFDSDFKELNETGRKEYGVKVSIKNGEEAEQDIYDRTKHITESFHGPDVHIQVDKLVAEICAKYFSQ